MKKYKSIYGDKIEKFICLKKSLGFKYQTATIVLSSIDDLAYKREEVSEGITKEFADSWGTKRLNESDAYRYTRVSILAQLSSFIRELNIPSYMPKLPTWSKSTFIPHIYSDKEILALFNACDELKMKVKTIKSAIFCMPVLLRLLYATGMRIGEALELKDEDINMDNGIIKIKDSKNGKERIIPFNDSLSFVFKEYLRYKNRMPETREREGYFFENMKREKLSYNSVSNWFKQSLEKAGIKNLGRKQGARIHDLRHTFACHALVNMVENGLDLYVSLPILSTYLGHQSLESTNAYVRLTSNMYPELIKNADLICLDVFPKTKSYESD